MRIKFKKFISNIYASALIEFALVLPIFVTLMIGSTEISFLIRTQQKQHTAITMSSSLAASLHTFNQTTEETLDSIAKVGNTIFAISGQGKIGFVFTFLQKINGKVHIIFQKKSGPSALTKTQFTHYSPNQVDSDITQAFIDANQVQNLDLIDNYNFNNIEQILVVEGTSQYTSIFASDLLDQTFQISHKSSPAILRVHRMSSFPNGGSTSLPSGT